MRLFWKLLYLLLIIPTLTIKASETPTPEPLTRSNTPIPYIYYYSLIENAFVVERADGTDSHLIGKDIMPAKDYLFEKILWSPSGEWLAWRGRPNGGPAHTQTQLWITSTDGSRSVSFFDEDFEARYIKWSPNNDWLFVIYETLAPNASTIFRVIDVPNERIL